MEEMLVLKDILRDDGDSGVHWSRCAGYRRSTYVPWSLNSGRGRSCSRGSTLERNRRDLGHTGDVRLGMAR
jgi:hypothetical protein